MERGLKDREGGERRLWRRQSWRRSSIAFSLEAPGIITQLLLRFELNIWGFVCTFVKS